MDCVFSLFFFFFFLFCIGDLDCDFFLSLLGMDCVNVCFVVVAAGFFCLFVVVFFLGGWVGGRGRGVDCVSVRCGL